MTGKFSIGSNRKLGPNIGTICRVAGETCPGKTKWCDKYCYANAGLFNFWEESYNSSLDIPEDMPDKVRLHSSGDFDTLDYINFIERVIRDFPETSFWAYTKSWRVPSLKAALEQLRSYDNLELIASMDVSIKEPPEGWRVAWIESDDRAEGYMCPHDRGKVENCEECGYCYGDFEEDVIFKFKSPFKNFGEGIECDRQRRISTYDDEW